MEVLINRYKTIPNPPPSDNVWRGEGSADMITPLIIFADAKDGCSAKSSEAVVVDLHTRPIGLSVKAQTCFRQGARSQA